MKKFPGKVAVIVCLFFMLTGCSKEVNTRSSPGDVQNSQITQSTNLEAALASLNLAGVSGACDLMDGV